MNDWYCHKAYAGEGARCTHAECDPRPAWGDDSVRADNPPPLARVQQAAESLIKARDAITGLEAQIKTSSSEIEKYSALRARACEELAGLQRNTAPALEALADSFGWSYRELRRADPFDEEEDDHA